MKRIQPQTWVKLSLSFFVLFVAFSVLSPPKASAVVLSNTSPNPSDSSVSGDTNQVSSLLVKSDHGNALTISLRAYFKQAGNPGTQSFIIDNDGCEVYKGPADKNGKHPDSKHTYVQVSAGSNVKNIIGDDVCKNKTSDSSQDGMFGAFNIPGGSFTYNGNSGYWVADITIRYTSQVPQETSDATTQHVLFHTRLSNSSGKLANVGVADGKNNSFAGKSNGTTGDITLKYGFGQICNGPNAGATPVTVYDADNGVDSAQGGKTLTFYITDNGRPLAKGLQSPFDSGGYSNQGYSLDKHGHSDAGWKFFTYSGRGGTFRYYDDSDIWKFVPDDGSNNNAKVFLKSFRPGHRFELVIQHMNKKTSGNNFLYLGVPGDSIYGDEEFRCPWALSGQSSVTAAAPIKLSQTTNFDHRVLQDSGADAEYYWAVKGSYNGSGYGQSFATYNGTLNLPGASASSEAGAYNPNYGGAAQNTYSFPLSAEDGAQFCEHIEFTNPRGYATTPNGQSADKCVRLTVPWRLQGTSTVCSDINYSTTYTTHPATCDRVYKNGSSAISDSATFSHSIKNIRGSTNANFNYQVKSYYDAGGSSPGASSSWTNVTASGTNTGPYSGSVSNLALNATNPNQLKYKYAFAGNAPVGAKYCQRIEYTDPFGPSTATTTSDYTCVTLFERPAASCALTASPLNIQIGESTTMRLVITLTAVWWSPSGTASFGNPPSAVTLTRSPNPWVGDAGTLSAAKTYNGSSIGNYTITGSYTGTMSDHLPPGGCTAGVYHVVARPYVKTYGGDVQAGFGPSTGGAISCSNSSARIDSWNNGTGGNYSGAGTQFGAQALDLIEGFVSAQENNAAQPPRGSGLSFANNANVGTDTYGGKFGNTQYCRNYSANLTESENGDGNISITGSNATVLTQTVNNSEHKTVYVKGKNVYIANNIVYAGSASYSLSDIPSFKLVVVGGNIYIKNTVTELAGMYIAQPSGSTGGKIYTCATGVNSPVLPTSNSFYTDCKYPLTVYGSFVAKKINFLRTAGEVRTSASDATSKGLFPSNAGSATGTSNAAERFIYGPEEWLGQTGGGSTDGYDAIVSLPPTL